MNVVNKAQVGVTAAEKKSGALAAKRGALVGMIPPEDASGLGDGSHFNHEQTVVSMQT